MRPIKLTISAFGPYADTQVVDFRELGDKRFFLIHGPTGAGKTSVLDAMTFALYGGTTGEERTGKDMRSLFAAPDSRTELSFDFAVGAEQYRVWRRPEQQRPKQRGEGTTTEKADAGLWRRDDCTSDSEEGEVVASGIRDVDARIKELLGFDCDQFRQVVVLPQGRFREVLSADVSTREKILKQLFKTDRFASMTEFLKQKRSAAHREIEGMLAKRAGVFENAGVESREQLEALADDAAQQLGVAEAAQQSAAQAAEVARAALEAARDQHNVLREAEQAAAALAALGERSETVECARLELLAARKALSLDPLHQALTKARGEAEAAAAEHAIAAEAIPGLEAAHALACEALDKARAARTQQQEAQLLDSQLKDALRLADDAERLVALRKTLSDAEGRLAAAEKAEREARTVAEAADAEAHGVELAWRSQQAAALAAGLAEGEPCPVCGSTEHPAPAPDADGSSAEELDAALATARSALTAAASATERAAGAREALDAARDALATETARLGADVAGTDAVAARATATTLAEQVRAREDIESKAEGDIIACEEHKQFSAESLAAARAHLQAATQRSERATTALDEARAAWVAALAGAELADEAAFAAVRRTGAEIDALEATVVAFDRDIAAARDRDERARIAAATIEITPDMAALETAERAARAAAADAGTALGAAQRVVAGYREAFETIDRFESDSAELNKRYELVARLADVADGSNELKLSFQRYVLGAYLDDVLTHANHRLERMTGGRYRLERSTTVEHRGRAAGLALSVYDEQAGESRPAGTLSGGEGFLASLALALGLAEAVQAHSGGVKLETVFIDEGFGTLDAESLEQAITTLLDLAGVTAEQGRLVGIISHVPELKQRIDARLEVTPGKRGSSARFVV